MSRYSELTREGFALSDKKRDAGLETPADIKRYDNIAYCAQDLPDSEGSRALFYPEEWNLLDVYVRRDLCDEKKPVLINFHGGGWVYGDKEVYQFYGMKMAQLGFAFVNPNYRLGPESHFPTPLIDFDNVCRWVLDNADEYGFDKGRIFAVGDSAGAHLVGLYAALLTGERYRDLFYKEFAFRPASQVSLKGLLLNCGVYDLEADVQRLAKTESTTSNLLYDLFGEDRNVLRIRNLASPNRYITKDFPPCVVMTSNKDFLNYQAPFMTEALTEEGVKFKYLEYGSDDDLLYHVFHCDQRNKTGHKANEDEADFLMSL